MQTLLMIVYVLLAIALIALILMQHGKGADAGAAFGSGASATVFGASGSSSFLSRGTAILATLFFVLSLVLAIMANRQAKHDSVVAGPPGAPVKTAPAGSGTAGGKASAPAAPSTAPAVPAPPSDVPSAPAKPASPNK